MWRAGATIAKNAYRIYKGYKNSFPKKTNQARGYRRSRVISASTSSQVRVSNIALAGLITFPGATNFSNYYVIEPLSGCYN